MASERECGTCWCVCGEGNYETLRLEPEKKNINISKLLREFFSRYYLAQHMTLVILSKGMYALCAAGTLPVRTRPCFCIFIIICIETGHMSMSMSMSIVDLYSA